MCTSGFVDDVIFSNNGPYGAGKNNMVFDVFRLQLTSGMYGFGASGSVKQFAESLYTAE